MVLLVVVLEALYFSHQRTGYPLVWTLGVLSVEILRVDVFVFDASLVKTLPVYFFAERAFQILESLLRAASY